MMKMKKRRWLLIALMLCLAFALAGCGDKTEEPSGDEGTVKEEESSTATVVKTIDEIDTEGMMDEPLQIESVTLYDDGSIKVVPLDEVKEKVSLSRL